MSNEIKIEDIKVGDTVDCSGWNVGDGQECIGGKVEEVDDRSGDIRVAGKWPRGHIRHWVRPDQITRHVPAAPVVEQKKASTRTLEEMVACEINWGEARSVALPEMAESIIGMVREHDAKQVERPKSVGDKLASEMTTRTAIARDYFLELKRGGSLAFFSVDAELAVEAADALIAAIDKERTP